jgi:hypothetical protein
MSTKRVALFGERTSLGFKSPFRTTILEPTSFLKNNCFTAEIHSAFQPLNKGV